MKTGKIVACLIGAALMLAPTALLAQAGPIYFTPKIMYSHQMTDGFTASGRFQGFRVTDDKYSGKDKSENTFGGGLAIGYDFGEVGDVPIRTELEYLIRSQTKSKYPDQVTAFNNLNNFMISNYEGEVTTQSVFANVYWDFRNDTYFTPYIGLGVGGAYNRGSLKSKHRGLMQGTDGTQYRVNNDFNGSNDSWNFAWNVSAGASYSLTEAVALDLSYRYSDLGEVEYGTHPYGLSAGGERIGSYGGKAKADLTAHEVILGVRISAF